MVVAVIVVVVVVVNVAVVGKKYIVAETVVEL